MKEYKNFKIITKEVEGAWYLDIRKNGHLSSNGIFHDPAPLFFKQRFNSEKEAEDFAEVYINKNY